MGHIDTLRRVMQGDFDTATEEEKARAVKEVIEVCAAAAAAAAFQPVPILDLMLISPIQIGLVQAIGRIHGHKLDQRSVLEILGTFGASLLAQGVIISAAKLVPFLGWAVAMSMGYALTWAVGEVSVHYFRSGRGATPEELKAMFSRIYREKRAEKEAAHGNQSSLRQRLEQLKEALAGGLITQAEFEQKKEEILRAF